MYTVLYIYKYTANFRCLVVDFICIYIIYNIYQYIYIYTDIYIYIYIYIYVYIDYLIFFSK